MLSNPHWNAPSFSSFEHWLGGRDPSEKYQYSDCHNCACAQYLKAVGKFDERWLGKAGWDSPITKMNALAAGDLAAEFGNKGHTFGELLGRVRARRQLETV